MKFVIGVNHRYFKPLIYILSSLFGFSLAYFTYLTYLEKFHPESLLLAWIAFFSTLVPFVIDSGRFANSARKSISIHIINLTLFTIALLIPQHELSFIFIWTFILILIVSFDPWIFRLAHHWVFPAYILLAYGGYSVSNILRPQTSIDPLFLDLERDVFFIGYVVLLFLALVTYFQRKRSYDFEMNLQEAQDRMAAILSTTESGVALYNEQARAVHTNKAALSILDVTEEEFVGSEVTDPFWEVFGSDGKSFTISEYPVKKVIEKKMPVECVLMGIKTRKGSRRWLRVHAKPLYMGADQEFFVIVSFTDITELIDANEMTSGFYRNSAHGMGILTTELKFLSFNMGLQNNFHVKDPGSIYDYIVTEDILYFEEGLEKARRSQVGQCYLRWQGDPSHIQNVDMYIYWSASSAQFFIQLHDITELRTLYVKQRTIMDALDRTTIMSVNDVDGNIKEVNKKFLVTTGFELEEILGQNQDMLKTGLHDEEFYNKRLLSLRKGIIWTGEVCNRNKEGQLYWIYSTLTPTFDDMGLLTGYIELGQDITALKLAQAQAVQSGKMATLGEMASGVAHEINNPLAVISGRVALLKKRLATQVESDPHKNIIDLEKVEAQVHRITKIVSGLRAFSRSSAKDPKVASSLKKIVEESVELVVERYLKSSVELEVMPFEDVLIQCRHIEISQVLVNLLNNAFDAVSELEQKWIRVEIQTAKHEVRMIVTDSGQGIASDVVDKIMNPFFTTKEIGKGTGLGLSISKGIIEDHGGTLDYNPKESHTQFVVKLPIYSQ